MRRNAAERYAETHPADVMQTYKLTLDKILHPEMAGVLCAVYAWWPPGEPRRRAYPIRARLVAAENVVEEIGGRGGERLVNLVMRWK
jgi:hypothetical protein